MRKIVWLSIVIIFLACNENSQNIKGDLYIKLIDFPSFYGTSDANFTEFKKIIDKIRYQESISKNEQDLVDYYFKLEKLNLLKTPFIKIKTKENNIKKIFLNPREYEKVKKITLEDLTSKKKKVSLELKIIELDSSIYYSNEIISLKVVDGETNWDK